MGKGDLWNALRGQVVETAKHAEVWREMDKFEKDKAREHKRKGEEGEKGDDRDRPKGGGPILSGAQMRNARNAEGSVDWKDKFSNDERFSQVFDGVFSSKSAKSDKVIDYEKMAAQAKAFAAQKAKREAEGIEEPAAKEEIAAPVKKAKRAHGEGAAAAVPAAAAIAEEPRPAFALKPESEALLKKIKAVATFVAKNGIKFEEVTKVKQEGNEEFCFLFGGEGEYYYKWLKYALKAGINPDAPPGASVDFDPVALAEAAKKIADMVAAASAAAAPAAAAAVEAAPVVAKFLVPPGPPGPPAPPPGAWQAVKDATGRTYFWNRESNTTSWDTPPGF